ncbi:MAG: ABC transporter permease [Deltaproteobacteria bacterium SM23_61]|nr:MAG: ABC transporter permease [Deltaproteobacteria bacterium SM23_61]
MTAYISRRFLQSFLVLIGVTVICFIMFQYMGDPVLALAGMDATQEQLEEAARLLGMDRPLYEKYILFLWRAVHGDLGISFMTKTPALGLVLKRMPATLELAVTAMLIATLVGGAVGVTASVKPHSLLTRLAMVGTLTGVALPTFFIGILSIYLFSILLGWFPPFGRGDVVEIGPWSTGLLTVSGWKHLILPAVTLGMFQLSMSTRVIRGEMMEVLAEDYIRTARAKGLSVLVVTVRHALKNALIPFVTIAGLQLGQLIAFSIVTETVFQWPGMGNLLLMSIGQSDQPVVITYIMVIALIFVFINLTVDILYCFLNPRITYA